MAELNTYRIDGLDRTAKGRETGLDVTLYNITKDQAAQYPSFCNDKFQADAIRALESAGVGSLVRISWKVKEGTGKYEGRKFYNIDRVTPLSSGGGAGSQPSGKAGAPAGGKSPAANSPAASYGPVDHPAVAIKHAINLTIAMLANPESGKFFPKTRTTPEILVNYTFDLATEILDFLKGERTDKSKSSTADLNPAGVDAGEPDLPGPPPMDDDDIPF